MQPVIVTYQDGHSELQYAPIPTVSSELLTKTFQTKIKPSILYLVPDMYKNVLYLYSKETACQYSWNKNGDVRMFDTTNCIMYEWFPKPTYKDAIQYPLKTGTTFIFKNDGTVIKREHPYPHSSPQTIWESIWPVNSKSVLIEGEESNYFLNWDHAPFYYGDNYWNLNIESNEEPNYYNDNDDEDYYKYYD